MGLFIIGILIGLTMFYVFGLSVYTAEIKQRVNTLEATIKEIEKSTKKQNDIVNKAIKDNDHEHE